jgi:hypothetical protein
LIGPLRPASVGNVERVDAEVSFVREHGMVTFLILHQNGMDQVADRIR